MYLIYLRRLIKNIGGNAGTINANRPIHISPNGTNFGNPDMPIAEFLEQYFFDSYAPVINSFSGGATLEKGEDNLNKTLSFTITAPSGGEIASVVITSNKGFISGDIKNGTGDQAGSLDILLSQDTNETFTLTVTSNENKSATTSTAFIFRNRIFWGVANDPGAYNDTFIKGLQSNAFDADFIRQFTVNAGAAQYIYFAIPKSYVSSPYIDPPYFFLGTSVPGGMEIAQESVSYTYENNTEDYIIYKSANANLGQTDVIISNSPTA
ncbi:MAG TPA: hypothetical protein P5514_12420 [Bacteroidales bacterium]|nr:hypothetical protein [Bacteroidales bacterium]HRX97743.1 hypothetical protein [Bacteroidales bacterium]